MKRMSLAGRVDEALSHLMLLGLASIMEESGAKEVSVWWEDGIEPLPTVGWEEGIGPAEAVVVHVQRHADESSWVRQWQMHDGKQVGLFSPRISAPRGRSSWQSLVQARRKALDSGLTRLDHRMIGSLGEPAYWLMDAMDGQPDSGASRWEMKTRNRGEEFVGQRLRPLAEALSERSVEDVQRSLEGVRLQDLNHDALSRTPTGLTIPQPTDAVRAWCALWGIAASTLVPSSPARRASLSQTSGTWPRDRVHPQHHVMPVWSTPVSVAKVRSLLTSAPLDVLSRGELDQGARRELQRSGVVALVRFPVRVGGSASAPERMLLSGWLELLDDA